jgi:CRISPR-associated endonuclease/helicase Cas3
VLIVNPLNENLDKLTDIRTAKEKAERVLDEFRKDPAAFDNDRISPAAMAQYYRYHFFDRAHEMAYPVTPKDVERNDSLFSLLSANDQSVNAYKRIHKDAPPLSLRQSFMTAAEAFEVINTPTEGVIVPYDKEGARIIGELYSASRFDNKKDLLKQAQRYSVNMFPNEIVKLKQKGGIQEVWIGSGILCLDSRHYSHEFGASVEQVGQMDTLIG